MKITGIINKKSYCFDFNIIALIIIYALDEDDPKSYTTLCCLSSQFRDTIYQIWDIDTIMNYYTKVETRTGKSYTSIAHLPDGTLHGILYHINSDKICVSLYYNGEIIMMANTVRLIKIGKVNTEFIIESGDHIKFSTNEGVLVNGIQRTPEYCLSLFRI